MYYVLDHGPLVVDSRLKMTFDVVSMVVDSRLKMTFDVVSISLGFIIPVCVLVFCNFRLICSLRQILLNQQVMLVQSSVVVLEESPCPRGS